ncbi:VOC family protein [Chloroflexota bacterium]
MFKRIHHVEIVPSDFEKSFTFFTEIIGFSVDSRYNINTPPLKEVVFLRLGDTLLELFSITNPQPTPKNGWRVGCRRIALEVENMGKTIDFLKAKGISIIREPTKSETRIRAEFDGPDELSIEMIQFLRNG